MPDLLSEIKDDFRNQPIPETKVDPTVLDCYQIGIDVNEPLNQEGLVNLSSYGIEHGSQSAVEAQQIRRLLYHSMCAVGFASYDHEWWHFDFGTQMWVMYGGYNCLAYYGRADLTG